MRLLPIPALAYVCLATAPAVAAPGDLLLTLRSPEPLPFAHFGKAISNTSGNILVGEPDRHLIEGTDVLMPFVGAAYLFDGTTGELLLDIPNPAPREYDAFGNGVTALGERMVISASGSTDALYSIDATGADTRLDWPAPFEYLTTLGDNILTANPNENIDGRASAGAAYVLDGTTGERLLRIPNPEPAGSKPMGLGLGLAAVGQNIAVGSMLNEVDGVRSVGSVFLFDGKTGEALHRFDNPSPESGNLPPTSDWFGWSVAGFGTDRVIVGANEDDPEDVSGAGSAYVFSATTGDLLLSISNPDLDSGGEFGGEFGRSVAAVNENILVGAHGNSPDGIDSAGVGYLFDGDTGEVLLRIPNPEPGEFDFFGWTVAARGNDLLISASNDSFNGVLGSGSMYLFEGPQPAIDGDFNADGIVDQADLDLVLVNWGKDGLSPPDGWISNLPGVLVEQAELDEVLVNWGSQQAVSIGAAGVPEPSGLALAVCGITLAMLLLRSRERDHLEIPSPHVSRSSLIRRAVHPLPARPL